ncbi:MAG TPA: sugar ABC transporter ATP-binding protein [Dongiaceae bacterium]|nr:sugar ABC transporter ATP-binding protein [Dongiaceae bacterium]
MRGLHKYFGATHALRGVDVAFRAGRVHALLGANGSGKSTLVKILAGYHQADGGEIFYSHDSGANAIAFVHQDLGLVPTLSVTENLALTRSFKMWHGAISWPEENRRAQELLAEYDIVCDVRQPVGSLGPAEQTTVAIARAIASLPASGGVLVLDEPTARLPVSEADRLLRTVRGLTRRGVAILYISHRLDEVLAIADEVTVLRDGDLVHHGPIAGLDRRTLVRLIVGRDIEEGIRHEAAGDWVGQPLLAVENVSGVRLRDVTLAVAPGEVVGIAGLVGSGRSELGRLIFGLQKSTAGRIVFDGRDITPVSTGARVDLGIAYVPQERRNGVFSGLPVSENLVLANLASALKGFALSAGRVREIAEGIVRDYRVKAAGIEFAIDTLSGGNQQKVSLGKWMLRNPRMLILDEPTQGIDIGARTEIFATIRQLVAERNMGALVLDSDLDILAGYCDRVLVMTRGRLTSALANGEITPAALSHAVYGH